MLLVGCGRRGPGAASTGPSGGRPAPEPPASFVARCAACHGQHGEGDGLAAATLNPRPRNFRDPAWQRATTDEAIRQVITAGGPSRGLSALMPAQGELRPGELDELVRYLRALRRE